MKANNRLNGIVALITVGAIGSCCCPTVELFISEGAQVIVADIDEKGGMQLQKKWSESCMFKRTDVTREEEVTALMNFIAENSGTRLLEVTTLDSSFYTAILKKLRRRNFSALLRFCLEARL